MSLKVKSNGINFNVPTIEDLPTERLEEGLVCVVTDENRGGVFVYREANALINNGGTIFNGWTRQYDGAVNVKWFGAKGDGVTDDTIAIQSTIDSFGTILNTNYPTRRRSIIFDNGTYKVTKIDVPKYTDIFFDGAVLKPFNPLQTLDYLIAFYGFSTITNLVIDMEYSVSYRSATYTRGKYNTLNIPIVWRAKLAHIVGDPLWESSTLSYHGDSENIFNGGECNWCINAIEAFGMNTIIHLTGGIKLYSYKWTMDAGDSRKADWESRPEWVIKNHGAMIYVSNSFIGNFSSSVSSIISKFQEIDTTLFPDYKNTYGVVIVNNTHIETGFLFNCENISEKNAYTNNTYILNIYGCHGYVSGGNSGYYINLNASSNQKASILNCNFYGNTISSRAIYANTISVDYNISSFAGASKDAFLIKKIFNKSNALLLSANTSSQSLSSRTNVSFSSYKQADYSNSFTGTWYNSSNGGFIAVTDLYNVELDLSLALNNNPTIGTDIQIFVNSSIANGISFGTKDRYIRIVGHIPYVAQGNVIYIKAINYDGLSLDGSPANTLTITANI